MYAAEIAANGSWTAYLAHGRESLLDFESYCVTPIDAMVLHIRAIHIDDDFSKHRYRRVNMRISTPRASTGKSCANIAPGSLSRMSSVSGGKRATNRPTGARAVFELAESPLRLCAALNSIAYAPSGRPASSHLVGRRL